MTEATAGQVLILQHQADDGPGNLAQWLENQGMSYRVVDVTGSELPAPGRYRALAVLGSKESAYDPGIAWVRAERRFVGECIAAGTPVLGICFGAQMLALCLGGQVSKMAGTELGWCDVAGSEPYGGTWFVWHGDEIRVAPGSATLAKTDRCVHAFTHGHHLGVQFHPEVDAEQIHYWLDTPRRRAAIIAGGGDVGEIARLTPDLEPAAVAAAGRLYESFFVNC